MMMRDFGIRTIDPVEVELIDLVDEYIRNMFGRIPAHVGIIGAEMACWDMDNDLLIQRLIDSEIHDCAGQSLEETVMNVYEKHVESTIECAFVTGFPKSISPLAKARKDNPRIAERFELIVNGVEIANGYSELNDPVEQLKAFEAQAAPDGLVREIDTNYIEALEYGMPPACGVGIGIDRLIMALTGAESIKDVILFPAMRR
jgi:lysyl-tRNA synthetase class 2